MSFEDDNQTTWHELISREMMVNNDSWENVEAMVPKSQGWLKRKFDSGYGGEEGSPFTVWTKNFVYFPLCYDGSEWAGSISRHPNGRAARHKGG